MPKLIILAVIKTESLIAIVSRIYLPKLTQNSFQERKRFYVHPELLCGEILVSDINSQLEVLQPPSHTVSLCLMTLRHQLIVTTMHGLELVSHTNISQLDLVQAMSSDESKPSLPLEEIATFDQSHLKHPVNTTDKTGVNERDKVLSAVVGGKLPDNLKHVVDSEVKVKEWMPTREDLEEDAKREQASGVPKG